jgi:37-kD nucleoid-associated bacterial protein
VNLGTFFIDKVIVHDVPRHTAGGSGDVIVFSDVVSDTTNELKNFFRERMNRSLNKQRYAVERDSAQTSLIPDLVAAIIGDDDQLVSASQDIARHLFACQTGVNPAGLVIVCTGVVDSQQCVGILKLEREDAIRVQPTGSAGARTFNIAHLRDLMLGKNTKLFKASLFVAPDANADAIDGLVSDDQRGYDPQSEVAQFFLSRFLGCRLKTQADVATKAFFEAGQAWINTVPDEAKKTRYELALLAQMNAPTRTITPNAFAEQNLEVEDRTPFRNFLAEQNAPTSVIDKDTRLVDSRIKQMTMAMAESKIRVVGTPEAIDAYVSVNPDGPESPKLEIADRVRDVRGGGR